MNTPSITADPVTGQAAWGSAPLPNGNLLIGTIAEKYALLISPDWRWHMGRDGKILSGGDFADRSGEWARLAKRELGKESILAVTGGSPRTWDGYIAGKPIPFETLYEVAELLSVNFGIKESTTKKGKDMDKESKTNQLQLFGLTDLTTNPDFRHSPSLRGAHSGPKSLFPAKPMPVEFRAPDGRVWGQGISPIEKRAPGDIAALGVEHLDLMRVVVRFAETEMKRNGLIDTLADDRHAPNFPKSIDIPRGTLHALLNPKSGQDVIHSGWMATKTKKLISDLEKGVIYYEDDRQQIEARILTVHTAIDKRGPKRNLHVYHFEFTDKFLELMQVKDSTQRHILLKQLEVGVIARCLFCRVPELITGRSNTESLPLAIPLEDLAIQIGVISERKPPSIVRRVMFGNPATTADLQKNIDALLEELNGKIRAIRSDGQEKSVKFAFSHADEVGQDTLFIWFDDKLDTLASINAATKIVRENWINAGGSAEEIDKRLTRELDESLLRACKVQVAKGDPAYASFNEAVYATCCQILGPSFLHNVEKIYKEAEKRKIDSPASVIMKIKMPALIAEEAEKYPAIP